MTDLRSTNSCAVPLNIRELASLTPECLFRSLIDTSKVFWFDSGTSAAGESWSYLGIASGLESNTLTEQSVAGIDAASILMSISQNLMHQPPSLHFSPDGGPPFHGGWIGYFAYDCLKVTEAQVDLKQPPKTSLHFFSSYLAYAHHTRQWWFVAPVSATGFDSAQAELMRNADAFVAQIASARTSAEYCANVVSPRSATSDFSSDGYCAAVNRALEYIRAGDIYQVNLSQRITTPWELSPAQLFLQLRQASSAQYGAFLGNALVGSDFSICSVSPELFLQRRGDRLLTRPIKGTRPRSHAALDNSRAKSELSSNAKERAELNMIVDLERNDLGRVCEYGSVRVISDGAIEELPTLFHRVAAIEGRIRPDCTLSDLLAATFPGGSVTGAPKIRAMQIIEQLERSPRGPYCGAIGWIGSNGDLELSVAIRTALCDGARKQVHYHAGSGIVADSDPHQEYEETLHKAAAFLSATHATLDQP